MILIRRKGKRTKRGTTIEASSKKDVVGLKTELVAFASLSLASRSSRQNKDWPLFIIRLFVVVVWFQVIIINGRAAARKKELNE